MLSTKTSEKIMPAFSGLEFAGGQKKVAAARFPNGRWNDTRPPGIGASKKGKFLTSLVGASKEVGCRLPPSKETTHNSHALGGKGGRRAAPQKKAKKRKGATEVGGDPSFTRRYLSRLWV